MRAHLLTFILILISSECPLLFAGEKGSCKTPPDPLPYTKLVDPDKMGNEFRMQCIEGYVRKAGTSNLFKCNNNTWKNELGLVCIPDPKLPIKPPTVTTAKAQTHTTRTTTMASQSSTSAKTAYVTTGAGKSTPTTSTAMTRTSEHTTPMTTAVEEASTANMTTLSSMTDTQYTTSGSSLSSQSSTTTTTTNTISTTTTTTTTTIAARAKPTNHTTLRTITKEGPLTTNMLTTTHLSVTDTPYTASGSSPSPQSSSDNPTTLAATTRTSNHTTPRKEETKTASVSTTTRSSLTDTQYTTPESSSSPQTSTTTATLGEDPSQSAAKHASNQAISIGIVLVIVLGLAATTAFLLWRRRSRRQVDVTYTAEVMLQSPFSGQPLLESSNGTSSPATESSQHLKAPTTVCTCAALAP